jgi:hypothetical protein
LRGLNLPINKQKLKVLVFFIPTIAYAISYLLSREDPVTATVVANMALPVVIIQMLLLPLAVYWKKKEHLKQRQNQSS